MADTRISNLTVFTSPLSGDVFPIVNNNITKQVSLYNAFNTAGILTSTPNYIYVTTGSSASANGINLLNAYVKATILTPNTSALSSTNRTTLILFPGTYDLGLSSLSLNTQYVDIIGMTRDASHVTITSSNSSATITQTANDVRCIGLTIGSTVSAAGWSPSNNLSLTYWENVTFSSISANNLSGTFKNCKSTNSIASQGGFVRQDGVASGTFINCTGTNTGSEGGGFVGRAGVYTGIFTDCIGINSGVKGGGYIGFLGGYLGTSSGTFINCTGTNTGTDGGGFVGASFSLAARSIAAGVYTNCTGTSTNCDSCGGFVGIFGIASGVFTNCTGICYYGSGGGGFAGHQGIISGTFNNCTGVRVGYYVGGGGKGGGDFVSLGSITGRLINCVAGTSWSNGGGISGQLINCIMIPTNYTEIPPGPGTYPALTSSGLSAVPACYVNCLDGSGRLVNGSVKYGIY
jgi:hypothetical protein